MPTDPHIIYYRALCLLTEADVIPIQIAWGAELVDGLIKLADANTLLFQEFDVDRKYPVYEISPFDWGRHNSVPTSVEVLYPNDEYYTVLEQKCNLKRMQVEMLRDKEHLRHLNEALGAFFAAVNAREANNPIPLNDEQFREIWRSCIAQGRYDKIRWQTTHSEELLQQLWSDCNIAFQQVRETETRDTTHLATAIEQMQTAFTNQFRSIQQQLDAQRQRMPEPQAPQPPQTDFTSFDTLLGRGPVYPRPTHPQRSSLLDIRNWHVYLEEHGSYESVLRNMLERIHGTQQQRSPEHTIACTWFAKDFMAVVRRDAFSRPDCRDLVDNANQALETVLFTARRSHGFELSTQRARDDANMDPSIRSMYHDLEDEYGARFAPTQAPPRPPAAPRYPYHNGPQERWIAREGTNPSHWNNEGYYAGNNATRAATGYSAYRGGQAGVYPSSGGQIAYGAHANAKNGAAPRNGGNKR
ncbi:hypothetical protein NESM_000220300 [Novymonas esmeraldas]|uniref:Uncharacterized protein n=1 Tax=Novymonas esmeraldas TaxID=1808958 RepID=A0AAW0F905_9TRYP